MKKLLFLLLICLVGCKKSDIPTQNQHILIEYNGCKYKIQSTTVIINQDNDLKHLTICNSNQIMILNHDDSFCKNPIHIK